MAPLTRRLAQHLQQARVQAVITHPYEGGHPDHDATAFIVHKSVALLASPPPVIVEMTSYHAAPEGGMRVGQFLTDEPSGILVALSPEEQARKRAMLDCFATQHATLAPFGVEAEAFRPAPSYDFTQPPHSGLLHYERYDWGMTGARWRALAAEACADLGAACPAGA
jgi:LmbE family N-acetylglucosaminyl deacetylase